jgi:2-amino-4-hydroxy-6-hydroxymethyldihydropteridine diphosphokinase
MNKVFLSLGSNLGNREAYLSQAESDLQRFAGTIIQRSAKYESGPWGFESEHFFLNNAIEMTTVYSPEQLLEVIKTIEHKIGRQQKLSSGYASRIIDIDILMYNNLIIDQPRLKLPHPHLHKRKFVLIPLAEIAPELVHPVFNKRVLELLKLCDDQGKVNKYK